MTVIDHMFLTNVPFNSIRFYVNQYLNLCQLQYML